jgi:2-phosphoglycerate kinase
MDPKMAFRIALATLIERTSLMLSAARGDEGSSRLVKSAGVSEKPEQDREGEGQGRAADRERSALREEAPRGSLSRFETHSAGDHAPEDDEDDEADGQSATLTRVRVDGEGEARPFMRGILVHSLTERGFSFEKAYEVAQAVWERVKDRQLVSKEELREFVREFAVEPAPGEAGRSNTRLPNRLDIEGKDGRWPFNQGRLQQSLLAAGLKPIQALEAVVEIERALKTRTARPVTRDSIRDLAGGILRSHFGEKYERRYLAWRSFQNEDDRPLILLLGGTSGVGKSSLAVEVARRLSIGRVLSTDSIRDVMRVMLSDDLVPTLHVSSFEAHTRLISEVREGLDPVIEGFHEQSRTVLVGVRAVIERAIAEGTSTVLDGVSLVPGLFDVSEWRDRAHIFFLLAADEDRESLHGHLVARASGRGTRATERYVRNFQEIFTIQEDLLERAETASVPVVDVQDLHGAARKVVKHVVDHLAEQRAAEVSGTD